MYKIIWISTLRDNSFGEVTTKYLNMIKKYSNYEVICIDVNDKNLFNIIIQNNPDFLIILWNDMNIKNFSEQLYTIRDKWSGKFVPFVPIDFENPIKELLDYKCDFYLSLNGWATTVLEKIFNKNIYTLEHIVTGFDELDKRTVKRELYGGKYDDHFIIGCVNANSSRKRLDLTIKAFNIFHKMNKKSILVLKTTNPDFNSVACNFLDLLKFTEYKENILIITDYLSNTILNKLYSSFDLMINTTDGEGFGLTPFEASLAGTLSILPYHTSFNALIEKDSKFLVNKYEKIPYEYARNTDDYEYISHGNTIRIVAQSSDSTQKCLSFINIQNNENTKLYILSHMNKPNTFDNIQSLSEVIDYNTSFQIGVTSDIKSLRYVLSILDELTKYIKTNITYIDSKSLESYIGKDTPHVSIVDPQDISNKMKYFYDNREDIDIENKKFKKYILEHYSEEVIYNKFKNILDLNYQK